MVIEIVPPERGMSLEEAIQEYVRIKSRLDELTEEKRQVMEVLERAAQEAKTEKSNTCRLANHNGSIVLKAEFKNYPICDVKALNVVKELIGDDLFEDLFKTTYAPLQSKLKPFLATKTTDETLETAKDLIVDAVRYSVPTPTFKVERNSVVSLRQNG